MRKKLQPQQKRFLKNTILALTIFLLPFIYYQPDYAQLEEADIAIERTYYSSGRRSPGSFIMTSDDGIYKIGGEISSREDFETKLTPNTNVQIKYYRGILVVIPMKFIEELTANGETIVAFHNDQKLAQAVFGIASSIVFIFGFLIYADSAHIFKKRVKKPGLGYRHKAVNGQFQFIRQFVLRTGAEAPMASPGGKLAKIGSLEPIFD